MKALFQLIPYVAAGLGAGLVAQSTAEAVGLALIFGGLVAAIQLRNL